MKWNPLTVLCGWGEAKCFIYRPKEKKIYTTSHVKQNRKLISSDFIGLSFINKHKRCISSRGVAPKSNWEHLQVTRSTKQPSESVNINKSIRKF